VRRFALGVLFGSAAAAAAVAAQSTPLDHLSALQAPLLTRCAPDGSQTYFRLDLNTVDVGDRPVGVSLQDRNLKDIFQVVEGSRIHPVVYAAKSSTGSLAGSKGNYIILLFDTSGSMNAAVRGAGTRFEVARDAIRRALGGFTDGVDRLVVAPFESHHVVEGIRRAAEGGATIAETQQRLAGIPKPLANNDTALYTSVKTALEMLQQQRDAGYAVSLVVFSDGENDVARAGNDRGLLGDEGLDIVRSLAASLRIPVFTVGFGVGGNVRAIGALKDIASASGGKYYDAESGALLTEILESTRRRLTDRIQILFGPVRPSRTELSGQPLSFVIRLRADGRTVQTQPAVTWQPPATASAVAETNCTQEEQAAIDTTSVPPPPPGGVWRRLAILVGFGALIATMWFGTARLMWPDRYVPRPTFQMPQPQAPQVPSAVSSYVPQPRMPTLPSEPPSPPRRSSSAPPASDETIFAPPPPARSPRPPAAPPARSGPRPEPPARTATDETVYMPPPKNPRGDR